MTIGGSLINFPGQSIASALKTEMHGHALMTKISEDGHEHESLTRTMHVIEIYNYCHLATLFKYIHDIVITFLSYLTLVVIHTGHVY